MKLKLLKSPAAPVNAGFSGSPGPADGSSGQQRRADPFLKILIGLSQGVLSP